MVELGEAEPEAAQVKVAAGAGTRPRQVHPGARRARAQRLPQRPARQNNCIFSINAGAGGTESCDWANMLLRMYQRWANRAAGRSKSPTCWPGETAGIKSATMLITGENAYRFLQSRTRRPSPGAHLAL